jgi:hypothetical protein
MENTMADELRIGLQELMRVTFLPQFLGAFPNALSPLGALP